MLNVIFTTILAQAPVCAPGSNTIGCDFGSPWGIRNSIGDLVGLVLNGGIAIGSIITLFVFIYGGISVIRGAGNNDPKAAAQGRQALTYAIAGLIIVLTAYWVIRAIEYITGSRFVTFPQW